MMSRLALRSSARPAAQSGQAMVESAVAFPLLLLVALGLVQFALFAHAQGVVTGAVQDGARVAAAEDGTLAYGIDHTRLLLEAGLGRSASLLVVGGSADADTVVIQADGRMPLLLPWLGEAGLPLRSRSAMHKERFRVGRD
jgi:hypothetical protein